ncbi:MAG: response regulator [Paracoccaceae bacterium]
MTNMPRIMHVEDDEDIRHVSYLALSTVGGMEIVQFSSGAEAIAGVKKVSPDLFLLDVMMPGMSGEQTLRELRKLPAFADTPAIFMTALSQQSDMKRLFELGALGVIQKPFEAATLAAQITKIWSNRSGT